MTTEPTLRESMAKRLAELELEEMETWREYQQHARLGEQLRRRWSDAYAKWKGLKLESDK